MVINDHFSFERYIIRKDKGAVVLKSTLITLLKAQKKHRELSLSLTYSGRFLSNVMPLKTM